MIRRGVLAEMRARGAHLVAGAAAETGMGDDVQWGVLEQLERDGALLLLVLDVAGVLVGHCAAAIGPGMWGGPPAATTLSTFVERPYRGRWGLRMLQALQEAAAEIGCQARVAALPGSRLEHLLQRLGAEMTAVTYDLAVLADEND